MKITMEEVERVATLARLELSEEEKKMFSEQIGKILQYANKLNELETEGVEPTSRAVDGKNVLRDDVVQPSLTLEQVLKNAPDEEGGQIRVPSILD